MAIDNNSRWSHITGSSLQLLESGNIKAEYTEDGIELSYADSEGIIEKFKRVWNFLTGSFPVTENSISLRVFVCLCELTALTSTFAVLESLSSLLFYGTLIILGSIAAYCMREKNSCLIRLGITAGMLAALCQFINNLIASPYDTRDSIALLLAGLLTCHSYDTPRRRDLDYSMTVSLLLLSYSAVIASASWFSVCLAFYFVFVCSALYCRAVSQTQENSVHIKKSNSLGQARRSSGRYAAYILILSAAAGLTFLFMPRFGNLSFYKMQHRINWNFGSKDSKKDQQQNSIDKNGKKNQKYILDGSGISYKEEENLLERSQPLSDRVIMKVKTSQETYYRGLAFSEYDGTSWKMGNKNITEWPSGEPMQILTGPNNPYFVKPLVQIFQVQCDMPNIIFAAFQPYNTAFPYGSFYIDRDSVMRADEIIEEGSIYTIQSVPSYAKPYIEQSQNSVYVNDFPLDEEKKLLAKLKKYRISEHNGKFVCDQAQCYSYSDDYIRIEKKQPAHSEAASADGTKSEKILNSDFNFQDRFCGSRLIGVLHSDRELVNFIHSSHLRRERRRQRHSYKKHEALSSNFHPDKHPPGMYRMFKDYLQLPPHISPRIKILAHELTHNQPSDYMKALAVSHFLRANFKYKNPPPPYPEDREVTDYFLFESGEGNCRQFAGAMAVICRAAGIPSRYVTGYAPGSYNPFTMAYEVKENDAHAWTEVMIPMLGWVSYDATSPHEAESGSGTASANPVISSKERSRSILEDAGQYISNIIPDSVKANAAACLYYIKLIMQIIIPVMTAVCAVYLLISIYKWLKNNRQTISKSFAEASAGKMNFKDRIHVFSEIWNEFSGSRDTEAQSRSVLNYKLMLSRLSALGINKQSSQTPRQFAEAIEDESLKDAVQSLTDIYEQAHYGAELLKDSPESREELDKLSDHELQKLRKAAALLENRQ